jgi:hypothetical protein
MLERTSYRVYPVIKEICSKMVLETQEKREKKDSMDSLDNYSINMKVLLGYLNQSEWMYLLNIGNIM